MQVEQQQSLACSATKRFTGNLLPTFKLMNISLQDGVIVNLGAALVHPGRSQHSAFDDAWNIFFRSSPELNLSMVAFEGQAKALKDNDRVLNETGGKFFLSDQKRAADHGARVLRPVHARSDAAGACGATWLLVP